jgi:IPT/TIG domain
LFILCISWKQPNDKTADTYDKDGFFLIEPGKYYGFPNRKRAAVEGDPRQCVWRRGSEAADSDFTPPITRLNSSTDGLVEFQSKHFKSQMRGNVIVSQYTAALSRIILSPNGRTVNPAAPYATRLTGNDGLVVVQAPNGILMDGRYQSGAVYFYEPVEPAVTALEIKSIFPVRGGLAGGSTLHLYGVLFSGSITVTVGGNPCTNVVLVSAQHITCLLPMGVLGKADVIVSNGGETDTFTKAFRYITGLPA